MAAQSKTTRTIKGLGVQYYLWGDDPVIGFGEVRGHEFQFRAAGGEWTIHITRFGETECVRRVERTETTPMPHDEAASLIEAFLREYVAASD